MAFLHGVETIRVRLGSRPVNTVKTAAIYVVGSANLAWVDQADQTVNENQLILDDRDGRRYFGGVFPNTTLGYTMEAIFSQGNGLVVAQNVLDPATHTASVSASTVTVENGEADLSGLTGIDYIKQQDTHGLAEFNNGFSSLVVEDSSQTNTYTDGTDYEFDLINQKLIILSSGGISDGDDLSISYDYLDPSALTTAEIIGSITGTDTRTGLKGSESVFEQFGFFPKIIIAPEWSNEPTVYEEMLSQAFTARALAYVDYPSGVSFQDALNSRGVTGPQNFNVANYDMYLFWPWVYARDGKGGETLRPISPFAAGVTAKVDRLRGFWFSPSNNDLRGVIRPEYTITARINDSNSQANQLNANGICTIFRSFGTGNRLWGLRSTAFPRFSGARTQISVERTAKIIYESTEYAMLPFLDQPISNALIDDIVETSNDYIQSLIRRGALIEGFTFYDPNDNPEEQLATGHIVLTTEILPAPGLERITFRASINSNLAQALNTQGIRGRASITN